MFIRPLLPDDLDSALSVYRQCEDFLALGPIPRASLSMVKADIQRSQQVGGKFCGIYFENGQLVGIIDYIPSNFEGVKNLAFIELLMIAKPERHKGLGRNVVTNLEHKISENGDIKNIQAAVQVNNPVAIAFWRNLGYRIISGPTLQSDGTTVYRLEKQIP